MPEPWPCCPHCVHGPGHVHVGPCLRPEEHEELTDWARDDVALDLAGQVDDA